MPHNHNAGLPFLPKSPPKKWEDWADWEIFDKKYLRHKNLYVTVSSPGIWQKEKISKKIDQKNFFW